MRASNDNYRRSVKVELIRLLITLGVVLSIANLTGFFRP